MIREHTVWIMATIGGRKTSFLLRLTKPRSLPPNTIALQVSFKVDLDDWMKRIAEVNLGTISPPEVPDSGFAVSIGEDTPTKVLKRMRGQR